MLNSPEVNVSIIVCVKSFEHMFGEAVSLVQTLLGACEGLSEHPTKVLFRHPTGRRVLSESVVESANLTLLEVGVLR